MPHTKICKIDFGKIYLKYLPRVVWSDIKWAINTDIRIITLLSSSPGSVYGGPAEENTSVMGLPSSIVSGNSSGVSFSSSIGMGENLVRSWSSSGLRGAKLTNSSLSSGPIGEKLTKSSLSSGFIGAKLTSSWLSSGFIGAGAKLENCWLFATGEKVFSCCRTGWVLNLDAGTLKDWKSKNGLCGLELARARQQRRATL